MCCDPSKCCFIKWRVLKLSCSCDNAFEMFRKFQSFRELNKNCKSASVCVKKVKKTSNDGFAGNGSFKWFYVASWCSTVFITSYPPASEASREVANLTWRKNPHPPVYGVKEFVCLSVCLSVTNFDLNYDFNCHF